MSSSRVGQNTNIPDNNCSPRVLILENDSLTTKLKFLEQNMEAKFESIKVSYEKKLGKSESIFTEKLAKQSDYISDKLYEIKSHYRTNPNNQKECSRRMDDIIKEQDRFNNKMMKMKETQENVCSLCPLRMKEFEQKLNSLKQNNHETKVPLNSSMAECGNELNDLSEISELTDFRNLTQINEFEKKKDLSHPNERSEKNISTKTDAAQFCPVQDNFGWNTPAGMHCSFTDFLPAENSEHPRRQSVIFNRYRLDYTASPASAITTQDKERVIESESRTVSPSFNQSFLYKRRSGQSNL